MTTLPLDLTLTAGVPASVALPGVNPSQFLRVTPNRPFPVFARGDGVTAGVGVAGSFGNGYLGDPPFVIVQLTPAPGATPSLSVVCASACAVRVEAIPNAGPLPGSPVYIALTAGVVATVLVPNWRDGQWGRITSTTAEVGGMRVTGDGSTPVSGGNGATTFTTEPIFVEVIKANGVGQINMISTTAATARLEMCLPPELMRAGRS